CVNPFYYGNYDWYFDVW
nr:immunoglobulin heavy chain junction region [Mus musculus]MBK4189744.1 immunoglobulin heavy chain junction region [Mus musculus]MBK4189745.1 immunoglobulin heavy chain junction region [Mus musculus]